MSESETKGLSKNELKKLAKKAEKAAKKQAFKAGGGAAGGAGNAGGAGKPGVKEQSSSPALEQGSQSRADCDRARWVLAGRR